MVVEYVAFERPTAWASIARSRRLDAKGREADLADRARLMFRTELRPKSLLALLLPLMRRTMHGRETRNLKRVEAISEGGRS